MTSSELPGSSPIIAWHQHQQQQQQDEDEELASSVGNFTSTGVTTSATYLRFRDNFSWIKIALVTVCSSGLLFNGFVLVVLLYAKRSRQVISNLFIMNQTVVDFLHCLAIIVNAVSAAFIDDYRRLPGASVICIVLEASILIAICNGASVINLIVLTMERYFKIVYHRLSNFRAAF